MTPIKQEEIAAAIEALVFSSYSHGLGVGDGTLSQMEPRRSAEARLALTAAILSRLSAAEAGREAHREQLQEALDEIDRLNDPTLKHMRLENGEINMAVAGPMVERLALAMTAWFRESGAENYVEMNLNARDNSDDRYCVTVQKVWAKSPHQLRAEAEAARDSALRERDELAHRLKALEASHERS